MSPSATNGVPQATPTGQGPHPRFKGPLKLSGALDKEEFLEITPLLGREYTKANLVEWLNAPNSDELLRDLAITGEYASFHLHERVTDECEPKVSQRGVVVFRAQDDADTEILKQVAIRLGELTGRPEGNGLSIHPFFHSAREGLGSDDYINCVSSDDRKKVYKQPKKTQSHNNWHSDLGFEACPGDYSVFLLTEVPETGGGTFQVLMDTTEIRRLTLMLFTDTMFASGCDVSVDFISDFAKPVEANMSSFMTACRNPCKSSWRA